MGLPIEDLDLSLHLAGRVLGLLVSSSIPQEAGLQSYKINDLACELPASPLC